MSQYATITSKQLQAIAGLDRGHGVRVFESGAATGRVDVFLADKGGFLPYVVSVDGEVKEVSVSFR